ncbi:hypothetical protein D3C71_1307940 [compost metagenome]
MVCKCGCSGLALLGDIAVMAGLALCAGVGMSLGIPAQACKDDQEKPARSRVNAEPGQNAGNHCGPPASSGVFRGCCKQG